MRKQRSSSPRTSGGVVPGSVSHAGSLLSTSARMCADGLAAEERLAAQHLEQHDAEHPDVGAADRPPGRRLLRAHVGGRAEDHIRAIDAAVMSASSTGRTTSRPVTSAALARPKSSTFTDARRRDLDVGRLEVAMDDPCGVRGLESVGDLPRDRERLVQRKTDPLRLAVAPVPDARSRPASARSVTHAVHQLGERGAIDQLHHDRLGGAVLHAVDRGDVRVVERSQRLRLAREPASRSAIVANRLGQDLDRDVAIELRVARAIHLAHAAGPERPEDFVLTEARPDRERHGRRCDLTLVPQESGSTAGHALLLLRPAPRRQPREAHAWQLASPPSSSRGPRSACGHRRAVAGPRGVPFQPIGWGPQVVAAIQLSARAHVRQVAQAAAGAATVRETSRAAFGLALLAGAMFPLLSSDLFSGLAYAELLSQAHAEPFHAAASRSRRLQLPAVPRPALARGALRVRSTAALLLVACRRTRC